LFEDNPKGEVMKYFFLFILALILCAAMALSSVLPGVTAYKQGEIEKIADRKEHTVSNDRYSVSGDRWGRVTVKNATTGQVIHSFQMDYGVVVRETFFLDGGNTLVASQKDHSVFWDLTTGKEIRRFPQRIYGFTHDETKFFTLKDPDLILSLYAHPNLTSICELRPEASGGGIMDFSLSPNDKFLVVMFASNYPESDENYPGGDSSYRTTISVNLFNLETCQEIKEFAQAFNPGFDTGTFSQDSNFIEVKTFFSGKAFSQGKELSIRQEWGTWRFNLKNNQIDLIN
jgi:hypothetical protein